MRDREVHNIFSVYRGILVEATEEQPKQQPKKAVTTEQKNRLVKLKLKMEDRLPIFSKLIRLAPVIFTYDLPTMAVDDRDNLYINPEFFDRLSDDGVVAVLAHEMYHIFHEHVGDGMSRGVDPTIHNYATDYVINRDLMEYGIDIKNITKDRSKPVPCLVPKKINNKYILRIGNVNKDVTNSSVYDLYKLLIDEAEKQRLSLEDLLKDLEKQTGENWDDQPIDTEDTEDTKTPEETKTPYTVGERVFDIRSDVEGVVIKASEPDENGDQILDIDWDISVIEKYIREEIETGVSSVNVARKKPPQPPKPPEGPVNPKPPSKEPKPPGGEPGKPGKGDKPSKEGKPGDKPGKGDDEKKKVNIPKPAEGQDEAPRSEPLTPYEKEEIRREGEHVQKEYQKTVSGDKLDIKGKGVINWAQQLGNLVRTASEERSTFLPDIRSTGAGTFIRGVERVKEDLSITVMVDTSGSVNESMFKLFMREVITIVKRLPYPPTINLILWHDEVYSGKELFKIKPRDTSKLLNIKIDRGGTDFGTALKFYSAYQKELKDDKAVIVFTDGFFNGYNDADPNLLNTHIKPNIPVIFALFQPSTTNTINTYKRNNKRIIETNIDEYS